MKISTRGSYALEALLDMTLHAGNGLEQLSRVAERRGLSENYLEQIFIILRDHGIVESIRGPRGGYRLAKSPESIRAGDVLRVLEGPLAPVSCVVVDAAHSGCSRAEKCVTRALWLRMMAELDEVADRVTLRDLADHAANLPGNRSVHYQI